MRTAGEAWADLDAPFQLALELAWESACSLSLGVGAVITHGDGAVAATGRNRMFEPEPGHDVLAGSPVAHAEMNALAKLRAGADHSAHTLWTTLEPCLLCAGGARLAGVGAVRYLSGDPLWSGLEGVRDINSFIGSGWATMTGPLEGPLAAFGLLLPLHASAFWQPEGTMLTLYEPLAPALVALAVDLAGSGEVVAAAEAGRPVEAALAEVWDRLDRAYAAPGTGA